MNNIVVRHRPAPQHRGLVIVVVLWVLVVLTVLVVALARSTRLDNAVRITHGQQVAARWLARAGVHQAMHLIAADSSLTDYAGEDWYENIATFQNQELTGGSFSVTACRPDESGVIYGIEDEACKLNVNTASAEMLLRLPDMTDTMADAIVRYRNNRSRLKTSAAETGGDRFAGEFPQERAIRTLRELLNIQELNAERLFKEDTNLNGILETNENDGNALPPPDNKDGLLDSGLLAYLTVYSFEYNRDGNGNDRLNINTSSPEDLELTLELAAEHTRWIVQNRPFHESIAELLDDSESLTFLADGSPAPAAPRQATPIETENSAGKEQTGAEEEPKPVVRPDLATFMSIADRITIHDDEKIPGRININTAGKTVLKALPGIDDALADGIIDNREQKSIGFESIADILRVPNMTVPIFKGIAPLITVRSNVFTLRSSGVAERTGMRHGVEAVVMRGDVRPRVLYWKESE